MKNTNTIAYVYKWTHIPSLKWYVGSRTKPGCHPDDGYLCSSSIVKPLIQANPEDWRREILATGTIEEMRWLESEILGCVDAAGDPRSFNQHNGGSARFMFSNRRHRESTLPKLGATKNKKLFNNGSENRYYVPGQQPQGWELGRFQTSRQQDLNPFSKPIWLGRKRTDSDKKNKSIALSKYFSNNPGSAHGKKWFTNGTDCRLFVPGSEPEGWILGRLWTEALKQGHKKHNLAITGRRQTAESIAKMLATRSQNRNSRKTNEISSSNPILL